MTKFQTIYKSNTANVNAYNQLHEKPFIKISLSYFYPLEYIDNIQDEKTPEAFIWL